MTSTRLALCVFAALVFGACTPAPVPATAPRDQSVPETAASPGPNSARNASVQWGFTQAGDHLDTMLAQGILAGQTEVDAAIYALNRPADVQALIDTHARCTCVRLISDARQAGSDPNQTSALQQLRAAGVRVRVNSHSGLMHMKVVEVDRQTLYAGSFNATNSASTINDEVLIRINSQAAAQAFSAEFNVMWDDPKRFRDWAPPPVPPSPVPALIGF